MRPLLLVSDFRPLLSDSFPLVLLESVGKARFRLLIRFSDKLLCILRIATPPSSVAKSNPRSTDTSPVAMSVRLAERTSIDGRGRSSVIILPVRDVLRDAWDAAKELGRGRFIAPSTCPCIVMSFPKSRWGSFSFIHRMISMSLGLYPTFQALARYRGVNARKKVRSRQNQKYADVRT